MTGIDWVILAAYAAFMMALSVRLGRGQRGGVDYYLGGRRLPWWAVGLSTMATQSSAISFISIPAFVALRPGGGLTWLQYELAVPAAMFFSAWFVVPMLRTLEVVSIYAYLEQRFGAPARVAVSAVFLTSRGLGTAIGVYATALVLSAILPLSVSATIVVIGAFTVAYDAIGGMRAVVYSDVLQMAILVAGAGACTLTAVSMVGGWSQAVAALPPERLVALGDGTGLGDGAAVPLPAYLIGGFFLYASYYGADQSQVQRELSTSGVASVRRALLLNGLLRAPLTGLYLAMGVAIGAAYTGSHTLQAAVPADRLDLLVPQFVLLYVPAGFKGLVIAALLAAAMSSLDSAINALSASTVRDFVLQFRPLEEAGELRAGRIATVAWGAGVTAFALAVGNIEATVIEAVNKIGSAFYGPVLALFVVGMASSRTGGAAALVGLAAGVGVNLMLWRFAPAVHWMWWNAVGFGVAAGVSLIAGLAAPDAGVDRGATFAAHRTSIPPVPLVHKAAMAAAFVSIALAIGLLGR